MLHVAMGTLLVIVSLMPVTPSLSRKSHAHYSSRRRRSPTPSPQPPIAPLPKLNVNSSDGVTISGISSGGAFAVQFHTAFSAIVTGAAIFAGKPYHCEGTDPGLPRPKGWPHWCNDNPSIVTASLPQMINYTKTASTGGFIDPVAGMEGDRVYLYIGSNDKGHAGEMKNTRDWYTPFVGASAVNTSIDIIPSQHCIPTIQSTYPLGYHAKYPPKKCGEHGLPFLELCNYDGAGAALQHLYGDTLNPRLSPPYAAPLGRLLPFDQAVFFNYSNSSAHSQYLSSTGYVFLPPSCVHNATDISLPACKLHVNLHGCMMGADNIDLDYLLAAGFNEWAEANRMVVLYPQIRGSACWDGYGDTGSDYALQSGVQMSTIRRMVGAALAK